MKRILLLLAAGLLAFLLWNWLRPSAQRLATDRLEAFAEHASCPADLPALSRQAKAGGLGKHLADPVNFSMAETDFYTSMDLSAIQGRYLAASRLGRAELLLEFSEIEGGWEADVLVATCRLEASYSGAGVKRAENRLVRVSWDKEGKISGIADLEPSKHLNIP